MTEGDSYTKHLNISAILNTPPYNFVSFVDTYTREYPTSRKEISRNSLKGKNPYENCLLKIQRLTFIPESK